MCKTIQERTNTALDKISDYDLRIKSVESTFNEARVRENKINTNFK